MTKVRSQMQATPEAWFPGIETAVFGLAGSALSGAAMEGAKWLGNKPADPFLIRVIELISERTFKGWRIDVVNQTTSGAAIIGCKVNGKVVGALYAISDEIVVSFGDAPSKISISTLPIHLSAASVRGYRIGRPELNVRKACDLELVIQPYNSEKTGTVKSKLAVI